MEYINRSSDKNNMLCFGSNKPLYIGEFAGYTISIYETKNDMRARYIFNMWSNGLLFMNYKMIMPDNTSSLNRSAVIDICLKMIEYFEFDNDITIDSGIA